MKSFTPNRTTVLYLFVLGCLTLTNLVDRYIPPIPANVNTTIRSVPWYADHSSNLINASSKSALLKIVLKQPEGLLYLTTWINLFCLFICGLFYVNRRLYLRVLQRLFSSIIARTYFFKRFTIALGFFLCLIIVVPINGQTSSAFFLDLDTSRPVYAFGSTNNVPSKDWWFAQVDKSNPLHPGGSFKKTGSFSTPLTCAINLYNPSISGCYQSGGQSKATYSVEVSWVNAPAGESIIVTGPSGSVPATRTITPGTISVTYAANNSGGTVTSTQVIVSPQVVSFEVPADGASGLFASASFSTTTSCSNTTAVTRTAPSPCEPLACTAGQIGGTVFFDFNSDGIKQSDEIETGVSGVTVTAIDVNGTTYSTTTIRYGRWRLNVPSANYPVRVEFSNLPAYAREGTVRGSDGNTTVQFVSAPDCDVDLGVLNNTDYCDNRPAIFTPCYVNGNPTDPTASSWGQDAFIKFDYTASGAKDPSKITSLAQTQEVGSLWGVAFNKYTKRIFTSATIKRHAAMGPEGIGGLYVLDPNTPGVVNSWDVNADFGINVGSFPSNATRGLPKGVLNSNEDIAGFTEIGKVGIGDIDISENGNQLYMVNLFDKKVYRINLTGYNANPATTPTTDASWDIPAAPCTNGQFRPFGLKWYKNFVYVAGVCDASTGTKSDLRAYVYRLNPTSGVWTEVFDFPLTYPKGFPNDGNRAVTGWYPWTDDWNDLIVVKNNDEIAYPQPMFTDIEIDVDGTLVMGFGDRTAMQTSYEARSTDPASTDRYSGFAGGDILRAFNNGAGSFILENAAKAGPNVGYAPTNSQGPGFGEYYNDDWFNASGNLNHSECVMGGLTLRPGSGQIIATHVDPVDGINWSGGVRHYNNTTGLTDYGFVLYRTVDGDGGTSGKAAGLGDMELGCALPTFIEIGNRVWVDLDKDGIQDPDESPLAGVKVSLYRGGTKIAETLTNASGEYYFSTSTPLTTDPNLIWSGPETEVLPSTAYQLVFGETQFASSRLTIGSAVYQLTTANTTGGLANDDNDSDPTIISSLPRINLTSPVAGAVNHSYDAGFYCLDPSFTITQTPPTCDAGIAQNDGVIRIATATIGSHYGVSLSPYSGPTTIAGATAFTAPVNIVSNAPNAGATYVVRIFNGDCYVDEVVTVSPVPCVVNCNCPCTSLVGNPSFESGLDDWTSFRVNSGTQTQYAVCGSSAGYMYYNSSGFEGNVFQELQSAIPGNTYTLTLYAGTGNAVAADQVRLKFLSNDYTQEVQFEADIDHVYTTTGGLVQYTISGVCPPWAGKVEVKFATNNTDPATKLVFDQVCLCSSSNCTTPTSTADADDATCVSGVAQSDGKITISGFTAGQRFRYSSGNTFNSGTATAMATIPVGGVIVSNLPNTTSDYTVRIFDATDDNCYVDRVVSITAVTCPPVCIAPTNINVSQRAPGCVGATAQNNGKITLNSVTNGTHYGFSVSPYSGPTTIASAAALTTPIDLITTVPNTGGSYVLRVFNGADNCFTDYPITVNPVTCSCPTGNCGPTIVKKN